MVCQIVIERFYLAMGEPSVLIEAARAFEDAIGEPATSSLRKTWSVWRTSWSGRVRWPLRGCGRNRSFVKRAQGRRVPAPRDFVLLRACSTVSFAALKIGPSTP